MREKERERERSTEREREREREQHRDRKQHRERERAAQEMKWRPPQTVDGRRETEYGSREILTLR